jgi:hypothetical protein
MVVAVIGMVVRSGRQWVPVPTELHRYWLFHSPSELRRRAAVHGKWDAGSGRAPKPALISVRLSVDGELHGRHRMNSEVIMRVHSDARNVGLW